MDTCSRVVINHSNKQCLMSITEVMSTLLLVQLLNKPTLVHCLWMCIGLSLCLLSLSICEADNITELA